MMGETPIAWNSSLQRVVATSTMEAEYMAMYSAMQDLVWIKGVLHDLGKEVRLRMYVDNKSAILLSKTSAFHKRSKHIDIKYHWIREKVDDGVEVEHISTKNNTADIFTKSLDIQLHWKHTERLLVQVYKRGYVEDVS